MFKGGKRITIKLFCICSADPCDTLLRGKKTLFKLNIFNELHVLKGGLFRDGNYCAIYKKKKN